MSMAEQPTTTLGQSVLDWLRAGYPEGIPPQDYLPILGVLQRRLTSEEIHTIAEGLAAGGPTLGVSRWGRFIMRTWWSSPSHAELTGRSAGLPASHDETAGLDPTSW
jgi:hypothetical protein